LTEAISNLFKEYLIELEVSCWKKN